MENPYWLQIQWADGNETEFTESTVRYDRIDRALYRARDICGQSGCSVYVIRDGAVAAIVTAIEETPDNRGYVKTKTELLEHQLHALPPA